VIPTADLAKKQTFETPAEKPLLSFALDAA